jgi:hypothetical protein
MGSTLHFDFNFFYGFTYLLKQIISWRGKPEVIRCDNGPEYISAAIQAWAKEWGIRLNTFSLVNHNKTLMLNDSIGRCGMNGCHNTIGPT